ncbi:MAG: HD-GYP domain-containing protein [Candidatus Nanopelagicales bacterium]
MSTPEVSAGILGRLLVGLQALDAFPKLADAARFVEHAINQVPGVESVAFVLVGNPSSTPAPLVQIPVETSRRAFGRLDLTISDPSAFAPYRTYLLNVGHAIATTLENSQVASELSATNALLGQVNESLEERVSQRTQEVELTNSMLRALSIGNEAMVHAHSPDELELGVLNAIVRAGGFVGAWLLGAPASQSELELTGAIRGLISDSITAPQVRRWLSDVAVCKSVQRIQHAGGLASLPANDALTGADTVLVIGVSTEQPIKHALCVATREGRWTSEDLGTTRDELLRGLAEDLAYGIARQRDETRAHDALTQAIIALGSTVEIRDPYTAGHQQRVSEIAGALAEQLRWPDKAIEGVRLAASIHDIGKVAIPSEILTKPARLNDIEMALMRTHSEIGAGVLRQIEFPWPIADMIHQHHERLDGSGYPQGLSGDGIIPGARVLMVADVAEAMIHARPYRSGLGLEAAIAELTRGRGTAYDAKVVDAFMSTLDSPQAGELYGGEKTG